MKNRKSILILLVLAIIAIGLISCSKPTVESITEELNKGNYSSAVSDFKELSEEDQTKMLEVFKSETEKIKDKFIKGEIDKVTATEALSQIKLIEGMEDTVDLAIQSINNIEASQMAFEKAKKAEADKNNILALEEYSKVIPEDKVNYDVAQAKIDELKKGVEAATPVEPIDLRLSKDIIDNQIAKVQFRNKSDKVIKQIDFSVFGYDADGYPIKVQFNSQDYLNCKLEQTLQPGETSKADWSWDLYNESGEITQLKLSVDKVQFYEGDPWQNPLYNSDIQKYAGKPLK